MITASEKGTLKSRGLIGLKNFLPVEKVARARQAALDRLEQEGIWQDGVWRLEGFASSTPPGAEARLVKGLNRHEDIANLIGEEVQRSVAELLDEREAFPLTDSSQVLLTLPNAEIWTVPHCGWHVDLPRLPDCGIPGVQIFTFLDAVMPSGGGTLVVVGSHLLVNENRRVASAEVKKILKHEPYFRDLMSKAFVDRLRFLHEPGHAGDVELRVVELHGEPGDVFFTDLRLLHTGAPNITKAPRIMLTQRFVLESLRDVIFGGPGQPEP